MLAPVSVAAIPVLETRRLRLRGHRPDDLADCAAMWADPLVTRHIGGQPFSAENVWSKILRYAGHWALLGFGYWLIEERQTGRFVGEAGLADFHRAITPPLDGASEAGWALAPWAHGRGLATEAVEAVVAWGDEHLAGRATVCIIDPANVASARVAEKCGYRELTRTTYQGSPTVIWRREATSG